MNAAPPFSGPQSDLGREQIRAIMPIGDPFLFIDLAKIGIDRATGEYRIRGDEFFFRGHFKDRPVMPASVMLEALGQLGVLWLLTGLPSEVTGGAKVDPTTIFFTSCDGVRCQRVCRPGELLEFTLQPRRVRMPLVVLEGSVRVGSERAIYAEALTLTFGPVANAPAPAS